MTTTLTKIDDAGWIAEPVLVDTNPEMADMSNPDGSVYCKFLFVTATTPEGRRFIHPHRFEQDQEDRASRFASRVKEKGEIDITLWGESYEVYGSPAWQEADRERHLAWQSNPATAGTIRDY